MALTGWGVSPLVNNPFRISTDIVVANGGTGTLPGGFNSAGAMIAASGGRITPGSSQLSILGIPTPGDLFKGIGDIGKLLGWGALAYGGYKILAKRQANLINIACLAYGLWATGIIGNITNAFKDPNTGQTNLLGIATAAMLPTSASALMFGAGGLILSLLGSKLLKPRRRFSSRRYYRPRYRSYSRRRY